MPGWSGHGPLVYCAEEVDNDAYLNAYVVSPSVSEAGTERIEALGGAIAVDIEVAKEDIDGWGAALYRSRPAERHPARLRLVPYHLWDNRDPGAMLVWLQAGDTQANGG
jgi:uncharacterized protein